MRLVIIDNYDSFTYILADYCAVICGKKPKILKNNELTFTELKALSPTHIIISPGPGTPTRKKDFGINKEIIQKLSSKIPILGICLGHQGIISLLGGKVTHAPKAQHGQPSEIKIIDPKNLKFPSLFKDLPITFNVMRYHSLIGTNIPPQLYLTAVTQKEKLPMAVQHKDYPLYGIQFHPESFGTEYGKEILENFLRITDYGS